MIRANDLGLRLTYLHWMKVQPAGARVHLINTHAPTSAGLPLVGFFLSVSSALLAEIVLCGAIACVAYCIWLCRADRQLAAITGMALFGVLAAGMSRSSQTLALAFGPTRVQAQMYFVFVVTAAIAISKL